jgi:hypothetical protein
MGKIEILAENWNERSNLSCRLSRVACRAEDGRRRRRGPTLNDPFASTLHRSLCVKEWRGEHESAWRNHLAVFYVSPFSLLSPHSTASIYDTHTHTYIHTYALTKGEGMNIIFQPYSRCFCVERCPQNSFITVHHQFLPQSESSSNNNKKYRFMNCFFPPFVLWSLCSAVCSVWCWILLAKSCVSLLLLFLIIIITVACRVAMHEWGKSRSRPWNFNLSIV